MSISKSMLRLTVLRLTVAAVLVLTLTVPVLAAPAATDGAGAPTAWSRVADQLSAWGSGLVQAFSGLLGDPGDVPVDDTDGTTTAGDDEGGSSGGGEITGGADPNG